PYDLRPLSRATDLDVAGTKELQDFTLKHGCASFGSRAKRRRPADVAERVPRPPFVLPLVEPVAQLRHHLFGEACRVVERDLVRHVAEVEQQQHVPDLHAVRDVVQAVDDGGGTASDDTTAVEDLCPGHQLSLHLHRRVPNLAAHSLADRGDAGLAGGTHIATL